MLQLPIPVLFVISITAAWTSGLARGLFSKKISSNSFDFAIFQIIQNVCSLIVTAILFAASGGLGIFSKFSVLLGICLGISVYTMLQCNLKAYAIGPFSYTSVITSVLSLIIPTISGLVVGETITVLQWVGIALMIVCVFFSVDRKKDAKEKEASMKWLLRAAASGTASGMIGIIQKFHQSSDVHHAEMPALLITGFATSAVLTGATLVLKKKHSPLSAAAVQKESLSGKKLWLLPVVGGVSTAFPNVINLFLAGKVTAVVVFPLVNLGPLLLSMLAAWIIFRERLSVLRWLGMGIGVFAMLLVSGTIPL